MVSPGSGTLRGHEKEHDSPCTASLLGEWIENTSMHLDAFMCYKGLQKTALPGSRDTGLEGMAVRDGLQNQAGSSFPEPGATNTYTRCGNTGE